MHKWILLSCLLLIPAGAAWAQEAGEPDVAADSVLVGETAALDTIAQPAPPTNVQAMDAPNDNGHSVVVTWTPSADDGAGDASVLGYEISMFKPYLIDTLAMIRTRIDSLITAIAESEGDTGPLEERTDSLRDRYDELVGRLSEAYEAYPEQGEIRTWEGAVAPSGAASFRHAGTKNNWANNYLPSNTNFYYRVDAITADPDVRASSEVVGPVQATGQWFNDGRVPVMIAVLIFGFLIFWFVHRARRGADLYVRPLAGIEAVDDAIGRATEMGRPILYVLGLGTAADVATIASFTILSRVAKRVAEYQTALNVPTYDPIVMTVAQEVVKSAYLDAGRPDDFKEETVHFVTQSQFAYVAAVNGIMLRERPATNVYMGKFFAESLILAETGALAGSIQISGTDEIAQIPFFIVACDYTLIGEELYAASAYLGREPVLLGSLKAQDYLKAAVIVFAIIGLVANHAGLDWLPSLFQVTN